MDKNFNNFDAKDKTKESEQKKEKDEKIESLEIFKNCIEKLEEFIEQKKNKNKNKNVCKLFCIAYVKVFCYKFINYINKNEIKDF